MTITIKKCYDKACRFLNLIYAEEGCEECYERTIIMEKITSFTIDHNKLQPGVYVSRKDPVGDSIITT